MKTNVLGIIKKIIVIATITIAFIIWCGLPNKVGIHFGASSVVYGNKSVVLPALIIIPLFGLIPIQPEEIPELHAPNAEDLYKEMVEDEKRVAKIKELTLASIVCITTIILLTLIKGSVE